MHINRARLAIFLFAWLALFGAAYVAPASAQTDQERALQAREAGAADLPALRRMVEKEIGGTVVGVSPVGSGKKLRYRFNVLRGADRVTVMVNAQSGAITSIKEPR